MFLKICLLILGHVHTSRLMTDWPDDDRQIDYITNNACLVDDYTFEDYTGTNYGCDDCLN